MSIALTGCSKREDLKLAEIKDRVITIHDYEDAWSRVKPEFLPKERDEAGKREFLDTMINRDVMAVKADELGYDKDPSVSQGMEAFKRMTTQVAFLRREVGEIKVTDAECKRYYELSGSSVHFKRMLLDREEQAQEAHAALEAGQDFTSAIIQYSKAEDAKEGGTVITAGFGQLLGELEEAVFNLEVGQYTEPIFTPQGWVIIQVIKIDRVEKQKLKYEEVEDRIRTTLKNQKETILLNAYTEKLREKYGVTWNYDSLEIIYNALPPDRAVDQAQGRDQEVYPILYFEAEDLDKPVVSYPARTITVKDFSDLYDRASFYNRLRKEMRLGGIRGFLTLNVMNDISTDAVAKSDIESEPEVKKILDTKRDELMVNLMFEDLVNKRTNVTYDQMQAFYDLNKEALRQPERRSFGVVRTSNMDTALRAQEEMLSGRSMAAIASTYSLDDMTLENHGHTGFQVSNGWMVLKLMELEPERLFTFDEARERVEAAIRDQENDKALKVLLEKWKEEFKVVVHEDNLKKVKLPQRREEQIEELQKKAKGKEEVSKG
jgi:parvulin-like peptidyl-prolyl isomerase